MSKIVLAAVGAAAYTLGAKAGHERYEQIMATARKLRRDPRVQQKKSEAADVLKERVVPAAKDHLTQGTKDASSEGAGTGGRYESGQAPGTSGGIR